ncbi:MAG: peptidase MA family metallohydrolase [Chloroflexi bacterium]|nr:peptidase MA family metallohydrolase [Chloroflexota bacterium]
MQFTIQPQTEFPDGLRFDITLDAPVEIVEARLRFRVLGEQVSRNAPLEFDPASRVTTSLLVRTDTAARYIPPGAEIEYSVEATDAAGNVIASEPERTIFLDPRFEWSRIDAPGVYLLHYGGQEGRARRALEAAQEALERMGALMGVEERDTLRLTVYNSIGDMRDALPPRSEVQEGTLVTEGVSFGDTGVVLLLGGNPDVEGVAAHETVHFLMRFAVGRGARSVPAWLNEGLAEYANPFPSFSFENVFSRRLYDNTLLPLTSLTSPPGRPEDALLMYGQSESVVTYMIETYGEGPLQDLLRELRDGAPIDEALMASYGIDRTGIEQEWRTRIGAIPLAATPSRSALPTPIPRATLVPFGVGSTPFPTAAPGERSDAASPAVATEPESTQAGGCNRAEGGGLDLAVAVPALLLVGLLARRRKP